MDVSYTVVETLAIYVRLSATVEILAISLHLSATIEILAIYVHLSATVEISWRSLLIGFDQSAKKSRNLEWNGKYTNHAMVLF